MASPRPSAPPSTDDQALSMLEALSAFPEIDISDGLENVHQRAPLYLRLLESFMQSHGDDHLNIRTALANGQTGEPEHLAHSLKGVSSTLGLRVVHSAAQGVNDALRNNTAPSDEMLQTVTQIR